MSKTTLLAAVAFVMVVSALVLSIYTGPDYQSLKNQTKASDILHNMNRELPNFALIDHNQTEFDNDSFKGKWTLVSFIYTHCPDICPTVLMDMSMLKSILVKRSLKEVPEFVAITFDPKRDTPKLLKNYVTHFDSGFLGVSGEQKSIDQLVKVFGAYYERSFEVEGKSVIIPNGQPMPNDVIDYSINHTALLYLISPDGRIFASFPMPHEPFLMADDVELFIKNYQ